MIFNLYMTNHINLYATNYKRSQTDSVSTENHLNYYLREFKGRRYTYS